MVSLKEWTDELKLRLARLNVTLELDDPTIALLFNRARRDVQFSILARFPEHFGRTVRIDKAQLSEAADFQVTSPTYGIPIRLYTTTLPVDYIEPMITILEYVIDSVTYRYEARRMDKREIYAVQMQSWNRPTITAPAYAVEKRPSQSAPIMYLAGFDRADGTTIIDTLPVTVELWYTAALDDLELYPNPPATVSDLEQRIPWQFEELVLHTAMLDALQKINNTIAQESVKAEMEMLKSLLQEDYSIDKLSAGPLLPSRQPLPGS